MRSDAVDRHTLHKYLWRKANRNHFLKVPQGDLAEALGITKWTVNKILRELIDAGRLKKVPDSVSSYVVRDPSLWEVPCKPCK